MKTVSILVAVGAILGLALGAKVVSSDRTAAELRLNNRILQEDLHAARTRADTLTAEKQEAQRQLSAVAKLHGELNARVGELESATAQSSASTSGVSLKPYRAEAFIGKQSLGLVWIVPRNLRFDTNSQRHVYEPVVALDEKLRRFFEVHHTNIIEQLVEVPVNVNNNYYPEPYSYSYGYFHPGRPTNSLPTQPGAGVPPPFNPGNATIIKQPLGTPAGTIQTYPVIPQLPVEPPPTPAPRPPGVRPPAVRPPMPKSPTTPTTPSPVQPGNGFRAASL